MFILCHGGDEIGNDYLSKCKNVQVFGEKGVLRVVQEPPLTAVKGHDINRRGR